MARKSRKKRIWFNSTITTLVVAFITSSAIGLWIYGFDKFVEMILSYIIGATFTGIVIFVLAVILFGKPLKKLAKKIIK